MYLMNKIYKMLNLIFPPKCPGCDKVLTIKEYDKGFCDECFKNVHFVDEPMCIKCGRKLQDNINDLCEDCINIKREFIQGHSVYLYEGPVKRAMYGFKYKNKRAYAKVFSKDMEKYLGEFIRYIESKGGIDAIVPVPISKKRLLKRGYNQAKVLADYVSKCFNIPVCENIIKRNVSTKALKTQNALERHINLIHAFKYNEISVKLNRILLIDDIYTTGATLNSIAAELRQNGVNEIYFICVCNGDIH